MYIYIVTHKKIEKYIFTISMGMNIFPEIDIYIHKGIDISG